MAVRRMLLSRLCNAANDQSHFLLSKTALNKKSTAFRPNGFCTSADANGEGIKLSSYLCIPPSQSQRHVAILTPYFGHLDFSPEGIDGMRVNLERRGMQEMDLRGLARDWDGLQELRAEVDRLERARAKTGQEIRKKLDEGLAAEQIRGLIETGQSIKAESKKTAKALRDLQETLMPKILALPNDIHPATPDADGTARAEETEDQGTRSGPGPYYEGRDALAELAALDYFSDVFAGNGFEAFSGPDFCLPVVVEACNLDFTDPAETFHSKPDPESKLTEFHLVGSASLPPFCAYFAKCSVPASLLPLKYFAAGRCYSPRESSARLSSVQSSRLHFFAATGSRAEEDAAFSACAEMLVGAYEELGFGCRLVEATPAEMSGAESRRTRLQVRLPSTGAHRTVATVASCGEFVSRRLWMCRHDGAKNTSGFLRVVHGVGMSFPALLACIDGETGHPAPLLNYAAKYGR